MKNKKTIIKPIPPRGMRDQLPQQLVPRLKVLEKLKRIFELYGFQPLETPAMERIEILTGKYGEEGDKLSFMIMKRGADLRRALDKVTHDPSIPDLALADQGMRYDLTVPLARVYAQHHGQLPVPFKRYHVGPVWRADRPQHGRYREFIQCDVDIVGSDSMVADAEIINLAVDGLEELGLSPFDLHVNHRGLLALLSQACGNPPERFNDFCTALDKLDKINRDGVTAEMQDRNLKTERLSELWSLTTEPVHLDSWDDISGLAEELRRFIHPVQDESRVIDSLLELFQRIRNLGLDASQIQFNPTLARGLDYYTGSVFEAFARGESMGSLIGGGRYDGLVGMFLGKTVPAVGFSFGLERIVDILVEKGKIEDSTQAAVVQVLDLEGNAQSTEFSGKALRFLKQNGISCEPGYRPEAKLGKQIQAAVKSGVGYIILVGSKEIESLSAVSAESVPVPVKRLSDGEQKNITLKQVVDWIRTG